MEKWSLAQRHAQLEVLLKVESELQQIMKETKKEFQNVTKLLDELKPPTLKNKHKNNNHKHRRDSDESISSIDSINDTVLVTNKYEKVLVFDKARTSSNLTDNPKKSADPSKKMALASSNSTGHSDKSTGQSKKKMVASSNTTDSDKSAGPSKKMALASSNSIGHSDKSAGPSKKKAVTSSKTSDSDKSTGPSKKMVLASSNSTRHSDKSAGPTKKKAVNKSNTTDSDKSAGPSKKMALASSNSTRHSDKSGGPSKKKAVTKSNTIDSDMSAGPSKKKTLASPNTTDPDKSAGPSKKKTLASPNTTDPDKSAGPGKKKTLASSNSTDHSDESSDKENRTNNKTLQLNERIPLPVAAPVAQEEGHADLVPIGSGRTLVRWDKYRMVNWKSYSTATRSLLRAVFSREVLSTHSSSGKQSLGFPNRLARMCLDEQKVRDIVIAVRERFEVNENIIRNIITKCADESKMMKTRLMKQEENEQKLLRLKQLFYSNYVGTMYIN